MEKALSRQQPTGIGMNRDKYSLFVTSRRALLAPFGEPVVCELTVIEESGKRISGRMDMESAYMLENIEFTPSGDLALIPMIRPKNLVPSIQVERGFIMTNGIAVIEQKENGRTIQLLLDEPNAYYSDPFDVAITPDGERHLSLTRASTLFPFWISTPSGHL